MRSKAWAVVMWGTPREQTDNCENITLPQLYWRAVKICNLDSGIIALFFRKIIGNIETFVNKKQGEHIPTKMKFPVLHKFTLCFIM